MHQAKTVVTIQDVPFAPGILRIISDDPAAKLDEIYARLRQLTATLEFATQGAEDDFADERQAKKSLILVMSHVSTSLDDILAIAGDYVRKVTVAKVS